MKVYSCIVAGGSGFAPAPPQGSTLACCKPTIRRGRLATWWSGRPLGERVVQKQWAQGAVPRWREEETGARYNTTLAPSLLAMWPSTSS